jgi:hypothetical protein
MVGSMTDLTDQETQSISSLLDAETNAIENTQGYKVEGFYCDLEVYDYDDEVIHVMCNYGKQGDYEHAEVLTINRETMRWDD